MKNKIVNLLPWGLFLIILSCSPDGISLDLAGKLNVTSKDGIVLHLDTGRSMLLSPGDYDVNLSMDLTGLSFNLNNSVGMEVTSFLKLPNNQELNLAELGNGEEFVLFLPFDQLGQSFDAHLKITYSESTTEPTVAIEECMIALDDGGQMAGKREASYYYRHKVYEAMINLYYPLNDNILGTLTAKNHESLLEYNWYGPCKR